MLNNVPLDNIYQEDLSEKAEKSRHQLLAFLLKTGGQNVIGTTGYNNMNYHRMIF